MPGSWTGKKNIKNGGQRKINKNYASRRISKNCKRKYEFPPGAREKRGSQAWASPCCGSGSGYYFGGQVSFSKARARPAGRGAIRFSLRRACKRRRENRRCA